MTVQTFNPSDLSQSATNWSVAQRVVGSFAPHAQTMPNMTVVLDQGSIFNGGSLTEVDPQVVGPFSLPADIRVDRVVIDNASGVASIVTGTNGSLTPPAIPAGSLPVARVTLTSQTSEITNAIIVDERVLFDSGATAFTPVTCKAYLSANQTGAPSGVMTKINFDTVDYNVGGGFDTSNHKFQPSIAGYYDFYAQFGLTPTAGTHFNIFFYLNGSFATGMWSTSPSANPVAVGGSASFHLNGTSDYVEAYAGHNNGSATTISSATQYTFFTASRVA